MSALQPTVLLRHVLGEASHYDWLIARPGQPRLWTARVREPSSRWAALGRFRLQPIRPHRRRYLTYEGPIPGRGRVEQVDRGQVRIDAWTEDAATLTVTMRHFAGTVRLTRQGGGWIAQVD